LDHTELVPTVERARNGDRPALAELCAEFYPRVLRFMHYRVGPRFAEDLAAEVFLKVVRAIGTQSGSFPAWLFRIAANVVTDHFRASATQREASMTEAVLESVASRDQPAAAVAHKLDIARALEQLTDDQRELVTLKFIEGLSNADIGEITGRSPEAIRVLQFRALAAMRQFLSREEPSDGKQP